MGGRPRPQSSRWAAMLFTMLAAVLLEHGQSGMRAGRVAGVSREADGIPKLTECPPSGRGAKAWIEGSVLRDSYLGASIRNLPPVPQRPLRQISLAGPGLPGRQEQW